MLRVAVWMVPYFARLEGGVLTGMVPDLAEALARQAGVRLDLVPFENPADERRAMGMVDAFHWKIENGYMREW